MASKWLLQCRDSHGYCGSSTRSQYSPARVLDIGALSTGSHPILRQGLVLNSPYIALSHRWGTARLPRTLMANLTDRRERLPMETLSKTMRDAVFIAERLGFRYLWIDALCIIQDSAHDWFQEASKMGKVFSNAVLTIAAADSDEHTQGISRPRSARCLRPFQVPTRPDLPSVLLEHAGVRGAYVFPKSKLVGAGIRPKGTLDTRAWILQEQLLSPRILYFGKGEIFWDCVTVSCSESSPLSASLLNDHNPDETWAFKFLRRFLAKPGNVDELRRRIAEVWMQVIMNYSARNITKQSDKLIALEGILAPLSESLPREHVTGMWREDFWRQMIWWVRSQSPSKTAGLEQDAFPGPSWSWLSADRPVYYHNAIKDEDKRTTIEARKLMDLQPFVRITSVTTETFLNAAGLSGTLCITAPSFHYRLTSNDLKKPIFKSLNAARLKLNTGKWMLDRPLSLPLDMQCIIIAEETREKMLVCLCVIPDAEQTGKWRRVGLCHWDGLAWQVAKYIGREPEKKDFVIV